MDAWTRGRRGARVSHTTAKRGRVRGRRAWMLCESRFPFLTDFPIWKFRFRSVSDDLVNVNTPRLWDRPGWRLRSVCRSRIRGASSHRVERDALKCASPPTRLPVTAQVDECTLRGHSLRRVKTARRLSAPGNCQRELRVERTRPPPRACATPGRCAPGRDGTTLREASHHGGSNPPPRARLTC